MEKFISSGLTILCTFLDVMEKKCLIRRCQNMTVINITHPTFPKQVFMHLEELPQRLPRNGNIERYCERSCDERCE
ncbi:hypothetical protein Bhyg_05757 [Pseudolycoriella hygida]|uniref:Uncharacterized protein n=1 Tax=Pseudolycoriella hygida TaxID=35572 RepID=A0A9Q0N1E9_9DIPT|nr:hypothetical protein Bhyg_05757 [Pseudolycoriella hygida]